jgi:hypothetical protein
VIDCDEEESSIAAAIQRALDPNFKQAAAGSEPPYGRPGNAAGQIVRALLEANPATLRTKPFYDGPAS